MTNHQNNPDYEAADEQLMSDDISSFDDDELLDSDDDDEIASEPSRNRTFNMEARQRIEAKLEERRLAKQIDSYNFDDLELDY